MRLALLSPQSPKEPSSSAVARLEMFAKLPADVSATYFYFGEQNRAEDVSIGTYRAEGHPANLLALRRLLRELTLRHRQEPFTHLWTTLPPIMMALFAVIAKKRLKLPLIVDVRDPGISSARLAVAPTHWRYKIAWRLERWLYRHADAMCCTTPELADFLAQEFGVDRARCHIITNAGPHKQESTIPPPTKEEPLRLFYAGTFAPYQVIRPFLTRLIELHQKLPPLSVNLYGYQEKGEHLPELIGPHASWIKLHERVPRETVLAEMTNAHAVLVPIDGLDMPELYAYAVPLKYYEALAQSKPVLLFGGTTASQNLLARDQAGVHCSLDGDLVAALTELSNNYARYQKAAAQAEHSREKEAEKLFAIMKTL